MQERWGTIIADKTTLRLPRNSFVGSMSMFLCSRLCSSPASSFIPVFACHIDSLEYLQLIHSYHQLFYAGGQVRNTIYRARRFPSISRYGNFPMSPQRCSAFLCTTTVNRRTIHVCKIINIFIAHGTISLRFTKIIYCDLANSCTGQCFHAQRSWTNQNSH